jgi:hypothetical protein
MQPSANHLLLEQAYAAFNRRDLDAALALMSESVSWPMTTESGRATGREEVRAYWTRQWAQMHGQVTPGEIVQRPDGATAVRVHAHIRSLTGDTLFEGDLWHVYTIANGLIERMDVEPLAS